MEARRGEKRGGEGRGNGEGRKREERGIAAQCHEAPLCSERSPRRPVQLISPFIGLRRHVFYLSHGRILQFPFFLVYLFINGVILSSVHSAVVFVPLLVFFIVERKRREERGE